MSETIHPGPFTGNVLETLNAGFADIRWRIKIRYPVPIEQIHAKPLMACALLADPRQCGHC